MICWKEEIDTYKESDVYASISTGAAADAGARTIV